MVARHYAMIVEPYLQRLNDDAQLQGGRDVVAAGAGRAGGVVMRQDHPVRIKVEGTPYRGPQRDQAFGAPHPGVEILGDVNALHVAEDHQHALFAATAKPCDQIASKCLRPGIERHPQHGLARGGLGQIARRNDGGNDRKVRAAQPRQRIPQGFCRGRIERAQRAEAQDQLSGNLRGCGSGAGGEKRRQDA